MNATARRVLAAYELIAGAPARRCLQQVKSQLEQLAECSDAEIVSRCRQLIDGPKLSDDANRELFWWLGARDLGERDVEMLALAAEAFSRFPPEGVTPGSGLFEHQLLAAAHLVRGTLVQMDTGEGKTFALSTAALALLRVYPKVYIVTANPYLAARDAAKTAPFWNALGISVGRAVGEDYEATESWEARVVYTTLESLVFRSLYEDLNATPRLLEWSALLADEADAILLDESRRQFNLLRATDDPTKDWSEALEMAAALREEDLKVRVIHGLTAQLTAAGEAAVAEMASLADQRPVDRLAVFRDVEQAYLALRVAKLGHDYEVQENVVATIDPNSGWRTPGIRPGWVAPLERHLGLPISPRRSLLHFTDGITLLRRFRFIGGASGTVVDEALEYAMLLGLAPAVIPPRKPRQNGRLPDVIAISRERAHEWVVDEIAACGAERPVLVATDSTVEAQEIAHRLAARGPEGVKVHLVSDETIAAERTFERAGEPGVTIVSTRVSGRGVDIQLAPAARAAGGAVLIAVGHADEARIDRQLLGRVGRQGDPYTARFVNHPEDPLMSSGEINSKWIETILERLTEDGVIEAGTFPRQLTNTQRRVRRRRIQGFASWVGQSHTRKKATDMLRGWRQALDTGHADGRLPEDFTKFLAERFLATRYPALTGPQLPGKLVRAVAEGLVETTGGTRTDALELIGKATGERPEKGRRIFEAHLEEALVKADAQNAEMRKDFERRNREAEEAVLQARLRALVGGLEVGADGDSKAMLQAALQAAEGTAEVPVSGAQIESVLQKVRGTLQVRGREGLAGLVTAGEPSPSPDAFDPRLAKWSRRSSWLIASESLHRASRQLETGLDRAQFRASQMASGSRSAAILRTEIEGLCAEVEAALAGDLAENLLDGADPSSLDDLFANAEHSVTVRTPRIEIALPALPAGTSNASDFVEPPIPKGADALVAEYAAAVREQLTKEPPGEDFLVTALKQMIGPPGLGPLANPDVVAERYAAWKRSDIRWKELPPWRWRFADRYVRGFFAFLHDRGLASPLPRGLPQRSRSLARRAWKQLRTPALGLGLLALSGAAAIALVLGFAPAVSGGIDVGVGPTFLDRLLTAGALTGGSALAPALLALTGGLWGRLLRGVPAQGDAGIASVEQGISGILLASGAIIAVAPWTRGSALALMGSLLLAMVITVACLFIRNGTYRFEQITHFHLVALLAAGFAAFSALPLLIELGSSSPVLVAALLMAATNLLSRPLRQARISGLALRVDDDLPLERESLEVTLPVVGRLSVVPHVFGLAFAWTFSCVILEGGVMIRTAAGALAYFAILVAWALLVARSVTDPLDWQERMRFRQQTYRPRSGDSTLADALRAARRRVFLTELAVASVLVGLGAWLTASATTSLLDQLPLGMATLFIAVTVTDLTGIFVRGLSAPPRTSDGLDPALEEDERMISKLRGLISQGTKWMSGLLVVILALYELENLVSLGEFLVRIYELVRDLL